MPDKTSVLQQIKDFLTLIERQFSKKVKTLRSDNGTEFLCLTRFFKEQGILHETSCVHTPQQNGRAERKHKHILNIAQTLQFQANLPIEFWGECVLAAGHLINRKPTHLLENKTPYEMLHGQPPSLDHLRVFGCLAYAHNKDTKGDKISSRSTPCLFLGYPSGTMGWKLFDIEQEKVFISRDVDFQEDVFPYSDTTPASKIQEQPVAGPSVPHMSSDDHSETEDSIILSTAPANREPDHTIHETEDLTNEPSDIENMG